MNPKALVDNIVELIWRVGFRMVIWGGLGYLLFRMRSIIVAVILAAVLAYAIMPIVDFACAYRVRGVGRKFQRLIVTTLVFALLGMLTIVLIKEFITPFHNELIVLQENFSTYLKQLSALADSAKKWYIELPTDVQAFLQNQDYKGVMDGISNWSKAVVSTTFGFFRHLIEIILIPVLAFYFVLDSRQLKREFVALVPKRRAREALAIIHEINCIMRSYVIGQIILCAIAGLAVGLVLYAVGMRQYVLILSIFAGITRAIPVIGPIISGIAIVLLAALSSTTLALYLLTFFIILHFVESKFIMPKLIGARMQLHPVIIIVVLLIGAEFFGIFGMFMAAPVASLIRVLVRYYLIKPKQLRVWGLSHHAQPDEETLQTNIEPISIEEQAESQSL